MRTGRGRERPPGISRVGDRGFTLIEVLISALIVGIAAVGLALMYSTGNTWMVAMGDDRIALGLAEQKIEQLRARGFANVPVGSPATRPCPGAAPCYNETSAAWDAPLPAGNRAFTRLTCVQYVSDTDFNAPAYTGNVTTNLPCPAGAVTNTARITVVVIPAQREADPVRLQAWLTAAGPS